MRTIWYALVAAVLAVSSSPLFVTLVLAAPGKDCC
jgi:hypothetical protein